MYSRNKSFEFNIGTDTLALHGLAAYLSSRILLEGEGAYAGNIKFCMFMILLYLILMYTDLFIQDLIVCSKTIIEAPKDSAISRGSYKILFGMASTDEQHNFSGFISRNTFFQENFSIGLIYIPKEERGKICLLRCNGLHGEVIGIPHHSFFHIHTATAEDINNGIKVERHIEKTEKYSTLEDAIQFYARHINIIPEHRKKHFPSPSGQMKLEF